MLKRLLAIGVPVLALVGLVVLMVIAARGVALPVVDTRGIIADQQRDALYTAVATMSVIIVPVFVLVLFISVKYRETNSKATYAPNWSSNKRLEALWWGVPIIIVAILSVLTWKTSHSLDPYRAIESAAEPINVQVVALQWKWLFLYPDEGVASIGELAIPTDRPVNFTLTSDAPMNSFWIPQLGGQIYAMSGMSTKLHLWARESGDYRGMSANLSGEGHSSMTFTTKARSYDQYQRWISNARSDGSVLNSTKYEQLRLPSLRDGVGYYQLAPAEDLYDKVIKRYSSSHSMSKNETVGEVPY